MQVKNHYSARKLGRVVSSLSMISFLFFLASCAVGPDYQSPQIETPTAYTKSTHPDNREMTSWLDLYNDAMLEELVENARANNHSLEALYQRTLQARAIISREQAGRRPEVGASAENARVQNSEETGGRGEAFNSYNAGLNLGWELDLFGRVARLVEGAEADARAQEAAYEDLLLFTETEVAINYFRLRALVREIEAVQRSVETRRESLEIVQARFESGTVSDLDVARSETLLAESEADLAALWRARDRRLYALAVLTGESASTFSLSLSSLEGNPVAVPVGLPSELLQRRPDIQQSEQSLRAANARIGAAKATFFPRLTIGGGAGFASQQASSWFTDRADFYSVGPSVNLPIFQGGRLQAEYRRSKFAYAEALAQYQQTVIEAFAEVENALSGWQYIAEQRRALQRATASSTRAQDISKEQYSNGIIDFISVLDAERTALTSERRLAQIIGDEYENSVLLIRALGGSW